MNRHRPTLLLLLLLGGWAAAPARADGYPRQAGVDVEHYVFRVTLSDESDEIDGETTVAVRFPTGAVTAFSLDLASSADGKGMVVTRVAVSALAARFEHKDDRLTITVDPPAKAGERRGFTVNYHGVPRAGLRIGKNSHGERTFFSQNWPDKARQWLPTLDHPGDKATSEFLVSAPARYQVVANGLLQEERDLGNGRRLTHWKQSSPIATWLNAVGVAQFAAHHAGLVKGIQLESWVYPQDRDQIVPALEIPARRVIEFYSEHVGQYPYEKLAGVQAAGLGGGMEHASVIFYGERSVFGRDITGLVAHEIAHQWFGDSVTERDWDDVWLSEGFATYFALLFTEHDAGRDAFVTGLKRSRDVVLATEKRNPELAVIHANLADTGKVLNRLVYDKGAWTLHMLRGLIGAEAFWAGIRDYYGRYRHGNVSTDDFRRVMEEHSGGELSWFFSQWLKRAGSPVVEGSWRYLPQEKCIEIDLAQRQSGEPYHLPLEIAIASDSEAASPARIEKVELTGRTHHFKLSAEKEPSSVALDPNLWVLMKATFVAGGKEEPAPSIATVTAPPEALGLDAFYTKYVSAQGLPVVGSAKVTDAALREAAFLVDKLLAHRPEIREAMKKGKMRVAVMACSERTTDLPEHRDLKPKFYWNWRARGLGATPETPVVSCGEENLLGFRGDPYSTENILIHEFGHGIEGVGLRAVDPAFHSRLAKAFESAIAKGLWKGTYAASNPDEYWAEGVQSWFDTNRQNDDQHNHVDTREELKQYDPELAKLCGQVFGDGDWRYVRPELRKDKSHLAGYDPATAPTFEWEPELLEARKKHYEKVKLDSEKARANDDSRRND